MRKLAFAVMTTAAVLSFAACSKDNGSGSSNVTPTPVENQEDTDSTTVEDGKEEEVTAEVAYERIVSYRDAVKEAFGQAYIPSMEFSQDEIKEVFGLTPDMYDAILAEGPMMSVHVDTFVAVRPSSGNLDAVVDALKAYRQTKVDDTMQYPMNIPKIQGSRVEVIGDYVFFLMVGSSNEMFENDEDAVAAYEGFNQQAVDIIQETMDNE